MAADSPEERALELEMADYAALSASIAEGDRPLSGVLADNGITVEQWDRISAHFAYLLAEDEAAAHSYADAFSKAQDALKPIRELTPEAWAELTLEIASYGAQVLERHGLRQSDYLRLARHWAKALAAETTLNARYTKQLYALQKANIPSA